jgi:hypothetical protein
MKGTSNPTFRIGKQGATILQGSDAPSDSNGNDGDIYIQIGLTSAIWQKATGEWNQIGNFGTKIATSNTSVDTALVADTITMTAEGSRIVDVSNNSSSTNSEKITITNGSGSTSIITSDTSGTNPVDLILDLQGTGSLKIQTDAESQITNTDGSNINILPGVNASSTGGTIYITGGTTTASGQAGGNIVLTPGTPGSGGAAAQVLLAEDYIPSDQDSIVNRLGVSTLLPVTITTESSHTVLYNEQVILVNRTTSASTTIVLPNTGNVAGKQIKVKDAKGDAATNNITVNVNGGGNIDGSTSYVINTNYGKSTFIWNGIQWFTI